MIISYYCWYFTSRCHYLWTLSKSAFKCKSFICHILKVRRCKLYAYTSDFKLSIAEMTCWWSMNIFIKCIWVGVLELLKLWCPRKRAYDINIDSVFSPFSCGNPCKTYYALLSGGKLAFITSCNNDISTFLLIRCIHKN